MRHTQNVPQPLPSAWETPAALATELPNHRLEVGRFHAELGDIILLYATDVTTGEVKAIRWDQASPQLKAAARRWALDPLGLLARADAGRPRDNRNPSPAAPQRSLPQSQTAPSEDADRNVA